MADLKISQLTNATTPLAGTEVVPLVQSGTTKKVAVDNLTAGRAVSVATLAATTTIGVGGATPSASGAGLTFPATQSASSNANTLDDYEEGAWTPSVGGNATYTIQDGAYVKIGKLVTITGKLIINVLGTGSATTVSGLPFACEGTSNGVTGKGILGYWGGFNVNAIVSAIDIVNNTSTFVLATNNVSGTALSDYTSAFMKDGARIDFCATYFAPT